MRLGMMQMKILMWTMLQRLTRRCVAAIPVCMLRVVEALLNPAAGGAGVIDEFRLKILL